MEQKKQLTVKLKRINYSGESLGNDIQLKITANGDTTTVKRKIEHNATVLLGNTVLKKEVMEGKIQIPINVQIIEQDPLYNDIGSGSSNFHIVFDGSEVQTHSFQVSVTGDSIGDRNKTARFTLEFEAELKSVGIKYVKNVSKRGWLSIRHEDGLTTPNVFPYTLKVQVTEVKNGRDFFIIQEGRLKGHKGSVRLTDEGTSFLTEEDLHTDPVHLIYSKENEIVQIAGMNKAYWAVLDSTNPIANGVYDLEIPYEPHRYC